jgi:hypothetical protein
MNLTSTSLRMLDHQRDSQLSEIEPNPRQFELEQVIRKAIAQLRHSVKPSDPLEDSLYSPISGRRVSLSSSKLPPYGISRYHQRN